MFDITYNNKYDDDYGKLISQRSMVSLPIKYYDASWATFSREIITIRSILVKSAMIDTLNYRLPERFRYIYFKDCKKTCFRPKM